MQTVAKRNPPATAHFKEPSMVAIVAEPAQSPSPFPFRAPVFDDDAVGRRKDPRVRVAGSACYLSDHRILIARSADISRSGAFVSTLQPDPLGTKAALRLVLGGSTMVAHVEVCRVSFLSGPDGQGAGMGLKFVDLDKKQKRFLARYIAATAS